MALVNPRIANVRAMALLRLAAGSSAAFAWYNPTKAERRELSRDPGLASSRPVILQSFVMGSVTGEVRRNDLIVFKGEKNRLSTGVSYGSSASRRM